jgi:Icc-related predicted phosphoesterase
LRVQYCSDLHLEFEQNRKYISTNRLRVCGDILILAGDIVPLHDEFLNSTFFRFISENYRQVFWVPGNHEYYYRNISDFSFSFNLKLHENINIVNNIELQYEGIQFIFSTLWSKISEKNKKNIEQKVSDFDCITKNDKKFKVSDFNKLHEESLNFIRQSSGNKKNKVVIVTHHVPSFFCNKPGNNYSSINEAFCVNLTDFIERSNVNFWIYGHSHFNQKPLYIGKTILLTNQLGYIQLNEQAEFKQNAYFSI